MKKNITYILLLFSLSAICQENSRPLKAWYSIGVSEKISKKISWGYNRTYGFATSPHGLKYIQNTFSLRIKQGRHMSLSAGYTNTGTMGGEKTSPNKYRYFGAINWRAKKNIWRIYNGLKYEKHSPDERKYAHRLIYSFYIRPKSNLIAPKIKLTPFFNTQLYYNIGGKAISQYDIEGSKIGKSVPNGLHRIRWRTGFYFKPTKRIKLTIYGMAQEEFNTPRARRNHKEINVLNPRTGKTSRRFNNYFVLGMSAKYYLPSFYKKKNRRN